MEILYKVLSLFFCSHKWQRQEMITIHDEDNNVIGHKVVLGCQSCGDLKSKKL